METLAQLVERKPDLVKHWNPIRLKEHLDKPYSYARNDFPSWFLSASECKVLFGHYPQRLADGFFYQRVGHYLVSLYDCRERLLGLLESKGQ